MLPRALLDRALSVKPTAWLLRDDTVARGAYPVYEQLPKRCGGSGSIAAWDATIAAARGSNAP